MPLQWRNQIWQSLKESAEKRCSECGWVLECEARSWQSRVHGKLQALVYDILPSATAVFSYAIGARKLSANEQFFVGAQTVVSLLQTTEIKQGVSFIAATKFTPAQIKPKSFESRRNSFSLPGVDASHVYVGVCTRGYIGLRW